MCSTALEGVGGPPGSIGVGARLVVLLIPIAASFELVRLLPIHPAAANLYAGTPTAATVAGPNAVSASLNTDTCSCGADSEVWSAPVQASLYVRSAGGSSSAAAVPAISVAFPIL
jgi:hypothetical protein